MRRITRDRPSWFGRAWRVLRGTPPIPPLRDWEADEAQRLSTQREVVKGLVAYIPIAGILGVTFNLLIQVRGNQSVALAIVSNLPLGSLALVIAVNVATSLLPAVVAGFGIVSMDVRFDPSTRAVCRGTAFVVGVICVYVSSPLVLLGALLGVYLRGRVDRRKKTPRTTYFEHSEPPQDRELRALWVELRARLVLDGTAVPAVKTQTEPFKGDPRSHSEVVAAVKARSTKIDAARLLTPANAVYLVMMYALGIYGFTALTLPVQYAPVDRITVAGSTEPLYGYVFSDSADHGIFVPRSFQAVTPLTELSIRSQRLCRTEGFLARPIYSLIPVPRDADSNAVTCPAYPPTRSASVSSQMPTPTASSTPAGSPSKTG